MPSAQVTITQLPTAGPITGTESVPIVQNGQTVQTTTAAIAASPSQNQTFITVNQEPTLPNSRSLSGSTGIGLTDGGAQSSIQIVLNGVSGALESLGSGFVVKNGGTVVNRQLTTSANGISITNGNGTAGNPVFALDGIVGTVNNLAGTGIVGLVSGSAVTVFSIEGTANQIGVVNGSGPGNPTISIVSDPVIPGTGAMTLPKGDTAQRPGGTNGQIRYNTDSNFFEGYAGGTWLQIGSGIASLTASGGLTATPNPITNTGTIEIANTAVAAGSYGSASQVATFVVNAKGQLTSAANTSISISAGAVSGLATVATTGNYNDLSNKPTINDLLPTQTGNANKFLTTDGSTASWDQVDISSSDVTGTLPIGNGGTGQTTAQAARNALLPDQSGNNGLYLKTDGTNVSWATADALPSQLGNAGLFLTTNGTVASWAAVATLAEIRKSVSLRL